MSVTEPTREELLQAIRTTDFAYTKLEERHARLRKAAEKLLFRSPGPYGSAFEELRAALAEEEQ